jgi:quercetin dioxygenase-like cupin family protein
MTEYVRKKGTRKSLEVAAGQGTTMQILISSEEAPNFAFRKFVMGPDGGMPRHTNLVEHEQYVLKGSAIIEIGYEMYKVTEGDSVYIPSQVPHSYKAGKDGFEFICVVPNKKDKIDIVNKTEN